MKAQEVIEILNTKYQPEEEVIISWWQQQCFAEAFEISPNQLGKTASTACTKDKDKLLC